MELCAFRRINPIKWEPTADYNVKIVSDTIDYYRCYDLSAQVEFLFVYIKETIEQIKQKEFDNFTAEEIITVEVNFQSIFEINDKLKQMACNIHRLKSSNK